MARITVVTSHPPLSHGGHLVIAQALERALGEAGHDAALLYTPEAGFGTMASAYWSTWRTDPSRAHGGRSVDQVITLRFPSYAVRHPRQVCWLNHRMREYYDVWEQFHAALSWRNQLKERARRRVVHTVDRQLLTRNVDRVFAQSKTIQARLLRWGGIAAEVLYPPPPQRAYRCDGYGDFLFVVSRLTHLKRIGLVVDALAHPDAAGVRCLIAGDGEEQPALRARIDELGLGGRVSLLGRLPEAAVLEHLARCRAVCFPPLREDYGFVTSEAFASRKAVITCSDSGGPAELVESGVNGLVTAPTAPALAAAIRTVMGDVALAERYGTAGADVAGRLTWEETVSRLVLV
ncbi:MAG: glycosyltransferase family 4 protein [Vicinamibacterales bacterium]|jgi:glycosyltransferase involved in cell wall biosynthesis|nr:hypothetical protein [Acidobacteriota bacterium]MDP6373740.1 glycosyltransferase family 4 protein [Vicinamibacterales bacterium]MDP6607520.1 glycosyltransferase family 4 protein [Vicinamibacterales bacterium]HAK55732.1 hypothetical protein [Acidobacteriota bacterium]|tara:strand:+ start:102 stop:1145 length:1044 start_codon:yes stop_codon:yes gene_type:complete